MLPENEFTALRRLLSLKRHEQPPPGYFSNFSTGVISALQIQRGHRRRSATAEQAPAWVVWLMERLQARPGVVGAVGALLCVGIVAGVVMSEKSPTTFTPAPSLLSELAPSSSPAPSVEPTVAPFESLAGTVTPLMAETNFQLSTRPSLFDTMPGLETAPVAVRP